MKSILILLLLAVLSSGVLAEPNVVAWGDNTYGQCNVPAGLTNAVMVAEGGANSYALTADGRVVAWGDNKFGQCNVPANLTNAVGIAAIGSSVAAVRSDGTVVAWGDDAVGYLRVPSDLEQVTQLETGGIQDFLALKSDRTARAWGLPYGHVGDGFPVPVTNILRIGSSLSGGFVAIRSDGAVATWGVYSDPGLSPITNAIVQIPADLTNAIEVAGGRQHGLALRRDGTVVAWGANDQGQATVPTGLGSVAHIAAGSVSSTALTAEGRLVVWGSGLQPPADLPTVVAIPHIYADHLLAIVDRSVVLPPHVLVEPRNQNVRIGGTAILSVQAIGVLPLRYQWLYGGTELPGQTNDTLVLPNLQVTQSGDYSVRVSNAGGTITSASARLEVVASLDVKMVPAIYLTGGVGLNYRLESISAFSTGQSWTTVATVTLTNSPQIYFDYSAVGQAARLYRLVQTSGAIP